MKPSMMVLDEATSALDSSTERDIQRALDAASVGLTMVVVAHRLSTVVGCNQILVHEAGEVLDEATSALDSSTERDIQRALDAASVGLTMVVVAHRLSTVVGCHQILVLEAGEVLERGS